LPSLDALHLQLRVLDAIAQDPTMGFFGLKKATSLPKATLAKYLKQLVADGYITTKTPARLGRGHKSVYQLTDKGQAYLKHHKAVLSLLNNITALVGTELEAQNCSVTCFLTKEGLNGFFVKPNKALSKAISEKIGGREALEQYVKEGVLPDSAHAAMTALAHGFATILLSTWSENETFVVAGGQVFSLPINPQEVAQGLDDPGYMQAFVLALKLTSQLRKNNIHITRNGTVDPSQALQLIKRLGFKA